MKKQIVLIACLLSLTISCAQEEEKKYKTVYHTSYLLGKDTLFAEINDGYYKKQLKENDTIYDTETSEKYVFLEDNKFLNLCYRHLYLMKKEGKSYEILDKIGQPSDAPKNHDQYYGPRDFEVLKNGDILFRAGFTEVYIYIG